MKFLLDMISSPAQIGRRFLFLSCSYWAVYARDRLEPAGEFSRSAGQASVLHEIWPTWSIEWNVHPILPDLAMYCSKRSTFFGEMQP